MIRHDILPALVAESVEAKCAKHMAYQNWAEDSYRLSAIMREREYYSTVRVIECTPTDFVLVYGEPEYKPADFTGPFGTLDKAIDWFLNGYR